MREMTQALRQLVRALNKASERKENGLFKVEGDKCVSEAMGRFTPVHIFLNADYLSNHPEYEGWGVKCTNKDLERMTGLVTAPDIIGVFELPKPFTLTFEEMEQAGLVIALDRIQDPGNLGTIIRTCDWMGVRLILASHGTVDAFSPKVVQAAMGSIARVRIIYCDLAQTLSGYAGEIYGTLLDGEDIYKVHLNQKGIIVMGNEGQGLSEDVVRQVTRKLTIPRFGSDRGLGEPESLNVAAATAVTLALFRRGQ